MFWVMRNLSSDLLNHVRRGFYEEATSFENVIAICFLVALFIMSSFNCIRIVHFTFLPAELNGQGEFFEYRNALSAILIILLSLQAIFWFFNTKIVRTVGVVLSSVTMLPYIFLPAGVYVENRLHEKIGSDFGGVVEFYQ